jgi:pyruvate dehydrogenase kinase 2/3/4
METGNGTLLANFEKYLPKRTEELDQQQRISIQIACFLHRELAVRVAHRAVSLQATSAFKASVHIQQVCNMYKATFAELRQLQVPSTVETEKVFAAHLQNIYDRHASTLINMAKGANEIRLHLIKEANDRNVTLNDEVQDTLNEFYAGRIAIRMLLSQYLALREPQPANLIGLVDLKTSVHDIALRAVENAEYICQRAHGDCPPVEIIGRSDLVFPYVPSHIEYILVELLKNSMRATVETHGLDNLRPIKIIIADGEGTRAVCLYVCPGDTCLTISIPYLLCCLCRE